MNGDDAIRMMEQNTYLEAFEILGRDDQLPDGEAVQGIFRQLAAGNRALSDRQTEVLESVVDQFCRKNTCAVCGDLTLDDIPAFLETGLCAWHKDQIIDDDD